MHPLDYTFEILILVMILYGLLNLWFKYYRTNDITNFDETELVLKYMKLQKRLKLSKIYGR